MFHVQTALFLYHYRMKCLIIGQNCGVILICDWIAATLATASNRRKVPKEPHRHAVKRQLSIITTKIVKNQFGKIDAP
jgi:hypothetical protein